MSSRNTISRKTSSWNSICGRALRVARDGVVCALLIGGAAQLALGDQRRAKPPTFTGSETRDIFFPDLSEAFRGERPTVSSIRRRVEAEAELASDKPAQQRTSGDQTEWSELISPVALEDEVKRLRLHFDSIITTPGDFNSGGYREARVDLSALATLFAVINDYQGDVRWKEDAAAARDLIARTAFNCKAGSTQVYNEAKRRKTDLQALVSGSGLTGQEADQANDWAMIVDRSPLMKYAEQQLFTLEDATRNEASIQDQPDVIRRTAGVIALLGEVLAQEGMVQADDPDYTQLSLQMSSGAGQLTAALQRGDSAAVQSSVGAISQSCTACHQQYR